jgi:hypothetical protein
MFANPLVLAALAGVLVWFADQPTVPGYNPLLVMFWEIPAWGTASVGLPGSPAFVAGHDVVLSFCTVHGSEGPPKRPPVRRLRPNGG